jgi:crotonobetainyl-CoA:carnitine CoA-transferase CaiB-like acyl-CoA transferase
MTAAQSIDLSELGYSQGELPAIEIVPSGPVLPSLYRVDEAAASAVAAAHAAAAVECGARSVRVDTREAAIAFRSERYLRVDGKPVGEMWAPLSSDYRARDGRWIRLHCNFPHHAQAVTHTLGVANDRAAVEAAVALWDAFDLERAVLEAGGAAAAERTIAQWNALPQARALALQPLVALTKLDETPVALGEAPARVRPLNGIRVLDLTRVVAGPVAGRTLAAYGADVLHVDAKHLPDTQALVIDTGFGKKFAHLDLRERDQRAQLRQFVYQSDIFVQSYRSGALAHHGFAPDEVAAMRAGIVYVSITAYGRGPWHERRGFDSLVQMAAGITRSAAQHAKREAPLPLPAQALDHGTGWLAALGAIAALHRRKTEGGSWLVEVSLARTAEWLKSLGTLDTLGAADPQLDDVRDLLLDDAMPHGLVTHVRFPGAIEGMQLGWNKASA